MRRIEELEPAESDLLLEFLVRRLDDPAVQCRWRWTPGDLAIWDERSTNHRNAADYFQPRRIRRIEVGNARPYYRRAA
jgi:taurine dioxygenase